MRRIARGSAAPAQAELDDLLAAKAEIRQLRAWKRRAVAALETASAAFLQLADEAGDVSEWNDGGFAYLASRRVRELLRDTRANGKG